MYVYIIHSFCQSMPVFVKMKTAPFLWSNFPIPCFRGEDSAAPKTSSFISHGNFTIFKQIYLVNGRCRGLLVRFKPREFSVSNGGRVLAQTSMNHQGTLEIPTIFTMAVDGCGFSQNDNIHRMLATPILFPTNPRYLTTNSI